MILCIYGALIRLLTFLSTICVFPFNPQNKPCEEATLLALQMGDHTAGGRRGSSSGAVLLSTAELPVSGHEQAEGDKRIRAELGSEPPG